MLNDTKKRPSPDVRSTIYYYGMKTNGNEQNWDTVWKLYLNETDAQEKALLIQSLSAIKDADILKR